VDEEREHRRRMLSGRRDRYEPAAEHDAREFHIIVEERKKRRMSDSSRAARAARKPR